jgi:DNA-binding NtrC family response regulator
LSGRKALAHGDIPLAVEAMRLGAMDFPEKPFEDEALLASVRSALDKGDRDQKRQAERGNIEARLAALSTASAMSLRDWWLDMRTNRLRTTLGSVFERSRPTGLIS